MLSVEVRERIRRLRHEQQRHSTALPPVPVARDPAIAPWDLADGREVDTDLGPHWQIDRALPGRSVEPPSASASRDRSSAADVYRSTPNSQVVFFDLETCGFAGSMVFLIGVLQRAGTKLHVRQLWARNYAEEAAVLCSLNHLLQAGIPLIVSFNGKSFDWPHVRDRCLIHRVPLAEAAWHWDLLHDARRRWKHVLPNCKLQTLESHICGRHRVNDVPSHLVPEAYHAYVRSGDTQHVASILRHNALDLITLVDLADRL